MAKAPAQQQTYYAIRKCVLLYTYKILYEG